MREGGKEVLEALPDGALDGFRQRCESVEGRIGEDIRWKALDVLELFLEIRQEYHVVSVPGDALRSWMTLRRGDAERDVVQTEVGGVSW